MKAQLIALGFVCLLLASVAVPAAQATDYGFMSPGTGVIYWDSDTLYVNWTFKLAVAGGAGPPNNLSAATLCSGAGLCRGYPYGINASGEFRNFASVTSFGTSSSGSTTINFYNLSYPNELWRSLGFCVWSTQSHGIGDQFAFGECYTVSEQDIYGARRSQSTQSWANATFEGQSHANTTRTEMNASLEGRNHANVTRAEMNASLEGRNHANITRTEMNASNAAFYESQTHANATWCPKVNANCYGNFFGNFYGNLSGVTTSLGTTEPNGLVHALRMDSGTLTSTESTAEVGNNWVRCDSSATCPPSSTSVYPAETGQPIRDNALSYFFDTSVQARLVTNTCYLNGVGQSFTVSGWVRPTGGNSIFFAANRTGNNLGYQIKIGNNRSLEIAGNATFMQTPANIVAPFGSFTHVATTWNATTRVLTAYANGTQVGTATLNYDLPQTYGFCVIGSNRGAGNTAGFAGDIAQFKMYNYALNSAAIANLSTNWNRYAVISNMTGQFQNAEYLTANSSPWCTFGNCGAGGGDGVSNDWFNGTWIWNPMFGNVTAQSLVVSGWTNSTNMSVSGIFISQTGVPSTVALPAVILLICMIGVALSFVSRTNPFPSLVGAIVQLACLGFWYSQDNSVYVFNGVDLKHAYGLMILLAFLGLAFRTFLMTKHSRVMYGDTV